MASDRLPIARRGRRSRGGPSPDETAPTAPRRRGRDQGFSLTETLVAITLMGMTVTTVLVGLRTTIGASGTDRDHAIAFSWLQAASDEIYAVGRVPCTTNGQGRLDAIAAYDAAAQTATRPPAWDATPSTVEVVDVEYLGRTNVDDPFDWDPSFCFEGGAFSSSPLYTQRVTLVATFPDGTTVQSLEMVKSE